MQSQITVEEQEIYSEVSEKLETQTKPTKRKHNYTSELELKSLLIRIKNDRELNKKYSDYNARINKYIRYHTAISNKKYQIQNTVESNKKNKEKNELKNKLKNTIISLSEKTQIDTQSYERFGVIILLMVKNILTKPQFSGYTYKDDFYSDAVYKILKYLHNFDHTKTSNITGSPVNAFAYISQIIHNSILYILNKKKKEQDLYNKKVDMEHLNHNLELKYKTHHNEVNEDGYEKYSPTKSEITETIRLKKIETSLHEEIIKLIPELERVQRLEIVYPKDYQISFDEYNIIKDLLQGRISIVRGQ